MDPFVKFKNGKFLILLHLTSMDQYVNFFKLPAISYYRSSSVILKKYS